MLCSELPEPSWNTHKTQGIRYTGHQANITKMLNTMHTAGSTATPYFSTSTLYSASGLQFPVLQNRNKPAWSADECPKNSSPLCKECESTDGHVNDSTGRNNTR